MTGRGTFYVTEKLGPKQFLTPEGFLLCEEVPIARTGMMIYGPDEVPVSVGQDGVIKVFREPEDVFRAETIASALGKPATNDHPDEDVTPESWKELTVGVVLNVRRGQGAQDDLLLADMLITTPEGIEAVQSGKREVSCGYEADYEEIGTGMAKQTNILINHVALVENGRCGPRCAIGDRQTINLKGNKMAKGRSKLLDALMKAIKAKDAAEIEKIADSVEEEFGQEGPTHDVESNPEGDTHIHIHTAPAGEAAMTGDEVPGEAATGDDELAQHIKQNAAEHAEMFSRIEALEQALKGAKGEPSNDDEMTPELAEGIADEVPEELKENAVKAKDSAYLADSFKDTVAMAEVLVPGIRIPTFDRSAKPGQSFKKICGLRRQALDLAYSKADTRGLLDDLLAGKDLDTKRMTCDAVRTLFRSAFAMQRAANNGGSARTGDNGVQSTGPMTLAELNRKNAERYGKH